MSGKERSNSAVKSVFIGVSTSVLTAVILYYLGIKESPDPSSLPRNERPASGYEEQLRQTDQSELARRQKKLEKKLLSMEKQIQEKSGDRLVQSDLNIAGVWQGTPGISYNIHQADNKVTVQEINSFYGITAVGQGSISGQNINLSYQTALGTMGRAVLTVSANRQQISGTFTDLTTGVSMPATLYR